MADFRIDSSFFTHIKTAKLKRLTGHEGVLCLIRLWAYASENRSKGVLDGMDIIDIELASGWEGAESSLVNALLKVNFIDENSGEYSLHNWSERNPYAYHAEERSEKARHAAKMRWGCSEDASSMQGECSGYAPSPDPVPNPVPKPDPKPRSKPIALSRPDGVDDETWQAFLIMRKQNKSAMTAHAAKLLNTELKKIGGDPNALLNQSIMNGWKSVFPLKDNGGNNGNIGNSTKKQSGSTNLQSRYGHLIPTDG